MDDVRTVRLYLLDGNANGRVMATLDNWNGVALRVPTVCIDRFKHDTAKIEEIKHCGIYFLFGHDDDADKDIVYIGQVNERKNVDVPVFRRYSEHRKKKAFCKEIVFFTVSDNKFGATELNYLENSFHNSVDLDRYNVDNEDEPSKGNVDKFKVSELDRYVESAKLLMSALGYKVFDKIGASETDQDSIEDEKLFLYRKSVAIAQAIWTNEGIAVLEGSQVCAANRPSLPDSVRNIKDSLRKDGALSQEQGQTYYILKKNCVFQTPSAAASFVLGGAANGRTEWKNKAKKTFDEIEKERASCLITDKTAEDVK